MRPEKLVRMANQIGQFFATQSKHRVAEDIADHLRKFWEPRMREQLCAYLDAGGEGLAPGVRKAVEMLVTERQVRT
ncbi:MAG: formate dehydrogenase subunit delta [Xanthobacteraceae bacterium]